MSDSLWSTTNSRGHELTILPLLSYKWVALIKWSVIWFNTDRRILLLDLRYSGQIALYHRKATLEN
jgi:hypothetical protein